jgi:predicted nucleic acid-binding Zn ribbon protein
MEEGSNLIANASGYSENVRSSLSPTLSYTLMKDSTIHLYAQNIIALEKERKARGNTLFWLMTVFTVICGVISYQITLMLRDHRLHFGQYIIEDNIAPVEQALDMLQKITVAIRDSLYTLISLPYRQLLKRNLITAYQVQTPDHALTINNGRVCKNTGCGRSIEHKSRSAKFCSDNCRNEWHNNNPK